MGPNSDTSLLNSQENIEGVLSGGDYGPLTLNLSDEDIARIINTRVDDSEAYWDKELSLSSKRDEAEAAYLGLREDPDPLYDHDTRYKNNRILTAIETLIPLALSQVPEPVVTEANDTEGSRELARNLRMALLALYEDLFLKEKLEMVARHLLIGYRLGVMKYRWDGSYGRKNEDGEYAGGICVETVRPQRVVIEQKTQWGKSDDVPLVAEYMSGTVEELCLRFPKKVYEIYKEFGAQNKKSPVLSSIVGYSEVWFTHYGNGKNEAVMWKYRNTVLDKMKNPNYNYDEYSKDEEGKMIYNNFFDRPMKPYIFFNHLNLGRFLIDDTSLTDQAVGQQDILAKRGRQIVDNADMANAGLIINSEMVEEGDVAKLIGDPDEKLMVKGPVGNAAARLPQNLLPNYVMQDKYDARNEIDNLYGTNAPLRGEQSDANTLGQEIIAQRSNMSRMQTLTNSLENGGTKLYRGLVQMMKVFWDEPTTVKYTGRDGYTTHMEFSQDKVEDGVQIRVKGGSLLPRDEASERNSAIQLAGTIDPLSLAEALNKRDPKEFAKRVVYYQFAMDKYLSDVLDIGEDSIDHDAVNDINLINKGRVVPVREEPTKEYLMTYANFIQSEAFDKLQPQTKEFHIEFLKKTKDKAAFTIKQEAPEEGMAADATGAMSPGAEQPMDGLEDPNVQVQSPGLDEALPGGLPQSPLEM